VLPNSQPPTPRQSRSRWCLDNPRKPPMFRKFENKSYTNVKRAPYERSNRVQNGRFRSAAWKLCRPGRQEKAPRRSGAKVDWSTMAGSFVRRQDNPRKPTPFRCSIRLTALFSVRRSFLVPSTVHLRTHPAGHVRSLSAGLWRSGTSEVCCSLRKSLRADCSAQCFPRRLALSSCPVKAHSARMRCLPSNTVAEINSDCIFMIPLPVPIHTRFICREREWDSLLDRNLPEWNFGTLQEFF
jgi:hypothetical protein